MCGIIGYIGERQACPIIFDGLARLEYRGYDSAGIVVASDGALQYEKQSGKLRELQPLLKGTGMTGTVGLGHTRWATHGAPTRTNAHPHFSMGGKLALVHNGIIENHDELRRALRKKGFRFVSETDSEVLCHLIASHYKGDLAGAVAAALKEVEGGFAIGVLHADRPDELVAARVDNPLIIGVGKGENFIASDIPAILPYTRRVIYLADGEIAMVRRDGIKLRTVGGRAVKPVVRKVDWDVAGAEKGGYPHFMLKEIHEQSRALADTIKGRIARANDGVIFKHLGLTVKQLRAVKRVHFVACGTAYHAALVGRMAVEELAGVPAFATPASEFRYGDPVVDAETLVIGVSQSGETIDTLVALRTAKEKGARCGFGLQRNRQFDPAPLRRRAVHPRRAGNRRGVDQGVHDAVGGACFVRDKTGPREWAPEKTARGGDARRDATHPRQGAQGRRRRQTGAALRRAATSTSTTSSTSGGATTTRPPSRARSNSRNSVTSTARATRRAR